MDNKKNELIEAAYRLVRTNGFDSFSYNDLSRVVGITKATIHYYFPSKEELGLAICDLIMQQLNSIKSHIDSIPGAQDKLNFYLGTIEEPNEVGLICPISSLQAEYNVVPISMQHKLKKITQAELELVAGILQAGLEEGIFCFKGEAMAQAILLVSSIKSAILFSRVLEKNLVIEVIDQFTWQLKAQHLDKV